MLRLAQERDRLAVIDDQVGAPTGAELIADVSAHAIRAVVAGAAPGGTYHLVAAGETSWHGYACRVIEAARAAGLPVKVAREAIAAVPSSEFADRRATAEEFAPRHRQAAPGVRPRPFRPGRRASTACSPRS